MVFGGYLVSVVLLHFLLRSVNQRLKELLILGYNFFFVVGMYFACLATFPMNLMAFFYTLGEAVAAAPLAITFQGDPTIFQGPDAFYIFFFMSLYTVRAVLAFFFVQVFHDIESHWRLLWHRRIFIIVGDREDSRALLSDITVECCKPAVIYIPTEDVEEDAKPLPGACEQDPAYLRRLKPGKKYDIILLPNKGLYNYQLLRLLDQMGERISEIRVTAFLDNEMLRMEDLQFSHLDLYLLSQEQMVVQNFMQQHLPLTFLKAGEPAQAASAHLYAPKEPFSLCMVGFDSYAKEFLLQTFENTAFETETGGPGLKALIVDENLERKKAAFLHDVPGVAQESSLSWLEASPWSEPFYNALRDRMGEVHQIVIATPDTEENIRLAMRLRYFFARAGRKPQIVVALFEEDEGAGTLLDHDPMVLLEQVNHKQFTYRQLVLREADEKAWALHSKYRLNSISSSEWKELGTFVQSSNRAVIWDIPNKFLLAGDVQHLSRDERKNLFWELARYEHRRWNAFYFARGWVPLPVRELTEEEYAACVTKRVQEKRHICLVGWDQLDALPQAKPGLLKYYDYANAAMIFETNP